MKPIEGDNMGIWQFVVDSVYDLFHLKDEFGQEDLRDWWETRKHEWRYLG